MSGGLIVKYACIGYIYKIMLQCEHIIETELHFQCIVLHKLDHQ